MFQDSGIANSIEFLSSWKTETQFSEGGTQTSEIVIDHKETQSHATADAVCQTEEVIPDEIVIEDDSPELLSFLLHVEEDVTAQLLRNAQSHAFDGYDVIWGDESSSVTCTHSLTHADIKGTLEVTSVSWNSTGSVVLAGYGKHDIEGFCTEKGFMCSWNIDRRNVKADKPDTVIEFPSCVVSVEAHPSKPGLTAVGTFNGVVFLVDTAQASGMEVVYNSPQDGKCHTEPISQMKWLVNSDVHRRETYQLVTVGGDGKVLVWDYSAPRTGATLTLGARHLVKTKDVPGFGAGRDRRAAMDVELGLTSVSFSCENNSTFVTGTDSGGVLKCGLKNDAPRLVGAAGIDLGESSPVTLPFASHGGPVYSVASSPFHRNMFLTASTDGTVRLYSHLDTKPLLIVEPGGGYLFDVEWSISRPMVFWASTSDGRILVYDLNASRLKPVASLEVSAKGTPVYCTSRNSQRPRLLASGDGEGQIKIWNLSDELAKDQGSELQALNDMDV